MMTGILPENMDDHIPEIHEDPLRRGLAFDAHSAGSRLGQDTIDMVGDRSRLPIRVGGPQDEIIGDGGQLRNVEDEDVRRLLVEHGSRDGESCGLRCSCDRRPLSRYDVEVYRIPPQAATDLPSMLRDRKSTRLNSSHVEISYAVFCLKKKK